MNNNESLKSGVDGKSVLSTGTTKAIGETSLDIHNLILNEDLDGIVDKINAGVYSLSKASNEDDRRKELHTGIYMYPVLVNEKVIVDIGFLPYDTEKILIINGHKKLEVSGDKKEQIKSKLQKVYTLPVYHSNPDGTARGAWL